jgi:hypothetical protein
MHILAPVGLLFDFQALKPITFITIFVIEGGLFNSRFWPNLQLIETPQQCGSNETRHLRRK